METARAVGLRAVALAALVVGAGLAGVVPAAATGGPAVESSEEQSASEAEIDARTPPDLPEQWRQTYGGSGDDMISDLVATDDGGYLLVGWTETDEERDGWVLKTDSKGQKQWSKTLGGPGTDRFWGLARTEQGYLLAGRTDDGGAKGWVVELDAAGEVRDQRTLGSGAFYAVERRDADAGTEYLLAGWTHGEDGKAGWTAKLAGGSAGDSSDSGDSTDSANLSTVWEKSYQTPEEYDDGYLRAVVPTDSGYYLAGKIAGDSDDGWALRVADDGTLRWQTTAGGPARDDVWAAAPGSTDGDASAGFLLAGETESDSTGPRDGWLVKFGPEGSVEWERRPGGEGTQWLDSAMRTEQGYFVTGGSDAGPKGSVDGYVVQTDEKGRTKWSKYYGTDGWDKPWPAIRDRGGYVLAGQTSGDGAQGKDGWLVSIGERADGPGTTTPDEGGTGGESANDSEETGDEAIEGDTATGTAGADGGVPGFGVGAALLALAAALLALRR
ncbi:hypothetical protein [Halorussus ruber]|uniref:hypothetical protein n=1 Tax=Halorussus ruber TaxID=1126238 RepID=UPI001091D2D7|nr:hypothetical protein [Halorussus ruber]